MPFWKNAPQTFRLRPGCLDVGSPGCPGLALGWPGYASPGHRQRLGRWNRAWALWWVTPVLAAALVGPMLGGIAEVQAQPSPGGLPALEPGSLWAPGPVQQDTLPRPVSPVPSLFELPPALLHREGRQLVLQRGKRRLLLLEDGLLLEQFPVAIGRPGWETPLGSFAVLEKIRNPTWQHPQRSLTIGAGPSNPLGSRWIGFWRDCNLRKPWEGVKPLALPNCATIGFHGTPQRGSVGRAVSHGCVRLYDEDVRHLFEQVQVGTPVTVVP